MNILALEIALKDSWAADTSYDETKWVKENPANGHCAVTALIVQDYFGGSVVFARAKTPDGEEISHYFNKIDGKEIDLTKSQFPIGTIVPHGKSKTKGCKSTREYCLSHQNTKNRYEKLKRRVNNALK